jgi:hypothetical protein
MLTGGDALADRLQVAGTPTAIVIDRTGRIAARLSGAGEARDRALRDAIARALPSGKMK